MVCFIRFVLFSGALCATYTTLEFVCFCVFRSVYGCNMFACMLWFSFHWHILLGFGAYSISIILYSAIFNVFLMCIPHRLSKQMRLVSLFFSIAHNLCAFTLFLTGRISRASNEKLLSNHFRRIFWSMVFLLFYLYFAALSWALFIMLHCCKRISNNDVKVVFVRRRLVTIGNSDDRFAAQHVRTTHIYTY